MRAYGLPRNDDVANPDVADIQLYGLAIQGYKRDSKKKQRSRRLWKKIERTAAKKQIEKELN